MQIEADAAKSVLGDDFVSPEEFLLSLNASGRNDVLQSMSGKLPDVQTLEWLAENKFILFPTPFRETTFISLVDKYPRIKFPERGLLGNERMRCQGWLAVRKEPYPESMVSFKHGSIAYESPGLFVPNVLTLMYAAAVYFEFRGLSLFGSTYITTSSMSCGYDANKAHCVHTYIPRWTKNDLVIEVTPSWMSERPMQKGMACARTWYT